MKKQLLAIAMVTMLLVATLISTVSATSITASAPAAEIKKGDKVIVTVNTDAALASGKVKVKYDTSKFSIEKADIKCDGNASVTPNVKTADGEAIAVLVKMDGEEGATTKNVTFTFTALADMKAEEANFELTEFSGSKTASLDDFTVKTATAAVKEPTPTTTPTQKPSTTPTKEPSKAPSKTPSTTPTKAPSTTTTPTKAPTTTPDGLAQTGAPLYVVGIAVVLVAALVLMVKKAK